MTTELWALLGFTMIVLLTIMAQSMAFSARFGVGATLGSRDKHPGETGLVLPRLERAVRNALEAAALFVPLVLVASAAGISNPITRNAALVFVAARALHPLLYAIGAVPFRTMAWSISFFALFAFAYGLISAAGLRF
jgi:uncharacterized MAPEG superfamily protein